MRDVRIALLMYKLTIHQNNIIKNIKTHSILHSYNTRNKEKLIKDQNTILDEFINIYNKLNCTELNYPKFKAAVNATL